MQEKGDAEVCPYCGYREGTPPLAPHYLRPGTVLAGKYLVGRGLGHGGFGTTYIARDQVLGIKLAIKEYLPQDCASRAPGSNMVVPISGDGAKRFADGLESFLQEARTLARFDGSPNIVGVRDFFTENGTAYLVMNYLEGITLKQYLVRSGGKPVPFEKMLGILLPVMDALRTVHAAGLLHRDVSPDNIFLTTSGQVTLIDFGAARQSMNLNVQNVQQQSVSAVQSLDNLYQENEYLKQSMDHLETQISNQEQEKQQLEQDLAASQDTVEWQQRSAQALDWFWQVDEAYVRGKYALCRTLMRHLEDTGDGDPLKNYLPQESATKNGRFSPYHRYEEIYNALH